MGFESRKIHGSFYLLFVTGENNHPQALHQVKSKLGLSSVMKSWLAIASYHIHIFIYLHGKTIPVRAYFRPWSFQEVEATRFRDNRHIQVVMLSALRTGRLYPLYPGNIAGTHFSSRLSRLQESSKTRRITSTKNPMTILGMEPATLWFAVECFNATPRSHICVYIIYNTLNNITNYIYIIYIHKSVAF
jgi:hypothetical protein